MLAQNKVTGGGAILACYCDYVSVAILTDVKCEWLFSCSAATLTLIDFVTLTAEWCYLDCYIELLTFLYAHTFYTAGQRQIFSCSSNHTLLLHLR